MSENVNLIVNGEEHSKSSITIPLEKKRFGDFISNLLGQPETIECRKSGPFTVDYSWLIHVHHLLHQRITQQNHAALVDFSMTVKFRQGSDRKITSIENFLHFNDARKVITKSAKLTWTYLVTFPNKPSPEKQEISVGFFTTDSGVIVMGNSHIMRHELSSSGLVTMQISHTERTWGDDIEALLRREIDSVFEKEKRYAAVIDITLSLLVMGLFISGLVVPDYVDALVRESEVSKILSEAMLSDSVTDSKKLDILIQLTNPNNHMNKTGVLFRIASFVTGVFLSVFCARIIFRESPSFVVITEEDKKRRERLEDKSTRVLVRKVLSFVGAVVAGVAGNYLYYYMNTN